MGAFFPVLQNEPFCRFEQLEPIFLGSGRTMSSGLGPPAARGEDSVCAMVWAVLCGFADSQDSHCPVGASPGCLGGWSFQQDRSPERPSGCSVQSGESGHVVLPLRPCAVHGGTQNPPRYSPLAGGMVL